MNLSKQLSLFSINPARKSSRSGTFVDNMKLPVHRWFRYSAGFSAEWVEALLATYDRTSTILLDPFAGSGTSLLASDYCGVKSIGIDAQPFVGRIARAKLQWNADPLEYWHRIKSVTETARKHFSRNSTFSQDSAPSLLKKAYSEEAFEKLESLRIAWQELDDNSAISELVWLTITAILRITSHAGTAPWQYVLPKKTKAKVINPFEAIELQANMMVDDMRAFQNQVQVRESTYIIGDARDMSGVQSDLVGIVITSPPYTNNYDYADATRLEMTFWREIERWSDLHEAARQYLVRSCTQHTRAEKLELEELLADPLLGPLRDELTPICLELSEERHLHGGKKPYHLMVAAYFWDMARVWYELNRVCKDDADLCFVLGDSAPYGIHIPVIAWHAALAEAAGFPPAHFSKLRDRNIKWQNRIHTVLLTEGELWLRQNNTSEDDETMQRKGSPGHKLGQLISNFFEGFFQESLQQVADDHNLFLDKRGLRSNVRGNRTKVTWEDANGTPHDLNYVFERHGSLKKKGHPVAFVELAWRRYTKHSRNKAGEIEGALYHLGGTYKGAFLGAIIGGEWSPGSVEQMEMRGINVLHVPFDDIIDTFAAKDLDLRYAEQAPDDEKWSLIDQWEALSDNDIAALRSELADRIQDDYLEFLARLTACLVRSITEIRIWYLYGEQTVFASVEQALEALEHELKCETLEFVKYEIEMRFSNNDKIIGVFHDAQSAQEFLVRNG